MRNYIDSIIEDFVSRCEKDYTDHYKYIQRLIEMSEVDLSRITEQQVKWEVRPFLYEWGRMGRVLGQSRYKNWESKIAELIQSDCKRLKDFRRKDLSAIGQDLNNAQSDIEECYESFRNIVGPIAASKTLHLICPDFFPLWDNDIARSARSEIERKDGRGQKIQELSGAEYYRFMQYILDFLKQHEQVISKLAAKYKRGKLRIVDETLWRAVHRPLSLFS